MGQMEARRRTVIYLLATLAGGALAVAASVIEPSLHFGPSVLEASVPYSVGAIDQGAAATGPVSYIQIINSCGPNFDGECVRARQEPATTSPVVMSLRNGVVLYTKGRVHTENGDWYHVNFNEAIRYPGRLPAGWYVSADFVQPIAGEYIAEDISTETATTSKRILIDRSEQMLYAYDGDTLFLKTAVSTGLELTPTPRGTFSVYRKTPSRYMQGPLPGISDQYYDLPGVSWNLYFTHAGGAIHGTYWHNSFGERWSHGCVNLPVDTAHTLYDWAPLGTTVLVQD